MPDKVTDLAAWKAAHPPAIRTANAMIRCWWKWASLAFWWPFLR